MKKRAYFYKAIWLLGFIVSLTIISQAESINTRSVASIQATAYVRNPLGLTNINDNYLTSSSQFNLHHREVHSQVVSNSKVTYDSLLLRIPFSGNVILEVTANEKVVKRVNFYNLSNTNINLQKVKEIGSHSFLLNIPSLFEDIPSQAKQFQITLIYTEN